VTSQPIRLDARPANDNSNAVSSDNSDPLSSNNSDPLSSNNSDPLSRPRERVRERANLASADARREDPAPVVSVSGDRSEQTYACSGNLILPLRFARRFPGWTTPGAGR
jgi:hypothetical protein